jgi:hypothetical protein
VAARLSGQPVPDDSQRTEAVLPECMVPDSSFSLMQRLHNRSLEAARLSYSFNAS